MLDELIIYGRNTAAVVDPWNRLGCIANDVLLFIEFCQIEGPRPLLWHPPINAGPHLDLDQLAIWLMASENQHGSLSVIYNQQLDLHCLIQHSTLFDITARAFQRPFCLVLLMSRQPSADAVRRFQHTAIKLFQPLLICNRQYFYHQLEHLLSLELEESNRVKVVDGQARAWYEHFNELIHQAAECDCGSEVADFNRFIPLLTQHISIQLIPLLELAPHAGLSFPDKLNSAYQMLTAPQPIEGILFSGNMAVMRSFSGANTHLKMNSNSGAGSEFPNENALKSLSSGLVQCVFPLLAGERLAILASQQRECTGKDLLNKLNHLRVSRRAEQPQIQWSSTPDGDGTTTDQLGGFSCPRNRNRSTSWNAHVPQFPVIIDLNTHRVRCRVYVGRLLTALTSSTSTSTTSFPSDNSLLKYIASLITDIHQLVLLTNYSSWRAVVRKCNLSMADQLILINCLIEFNLSAYSHLRRESMELENQMPYRMGRL